MSKRQGVVCLLSVIVLSSIGYAVTADRIHGALTNATTALRGNVHRMAVPEFDRGPVDPAMQLGTITLMTAPTAAQQIALNQLLAQQQDRNSPNYHKWLTPEQYADRFGLSQNDIRRIVAWLQGEGFTQVHAARGRNWVSFTGTAGQVQNAFAIEIHHFNVSGELHYANTRPPMIPAALSGIVSGFRGLHDFRPRPMNHLRTRPYYYDSTYGDFIAPGDLGTIYDINALYTAGVDGTGQKLAVMGQTEIYLADLNDFRSGFGLSTYSCTTDSSGLITACNDPHFQYVLDGSSRLSNSGDLSEADLDLEWSGAVAPGAQIIYVNSSDTFTSFFYAIDNKIAPVISLSYGFCEFDDTVTSQDETELQKANSEGITFVNSSGDTGAAECDPGGVVLASGGLAVSYPASSPEVTGVGGTANPLADLNNSTYWGTTNGTNGGTALSYVPEQAWNDDLEIGQYCQQNPGNQFCTQGGSTKITGWVPITSESTAQSDIGAFSSGGGASNCETWSGSACISGFAKPSWQTVTVAGTSTRVSPDISFLASPNFPGYIFCTELSELGDAGSGSSCAPGGATGISNALGLNNISVIGGTSASAPVFAGMVALLNQYTGSSGQGNINSSLYQLAATAPTAFHDPNSGDNKVYCQAGTPAGQPSSLQCPSSGVLGYNAATGFDLATGLGSLDVNNFAVALKSPPDFSASTPTTSLSLFTGISQTATITVTPINNFTGSVSFACSGLPSGTTCSFNPAAVTPPTTTQTTATFQASTGGQSGTVVITATTGTLSQVSHQAGSLAVTTTTPFTLTPSATSYQVAQGSNINATVALAFFGGFTGTVTFTCSDTAPQSGCTVPPPTNAQGNVSFNVTTATPTARLQRPLDRGTGIFYATLLPGLVGVLFNVGSRKRSLAAMRALALVLMLGFSMVWMSSCGGSSSGNPTNGGTPKGTYTITVTGTSGGSSATANFQLIVQ